MFAELSGFMATMNSNLLQSLARVEDNTLQSLAKVEVNTLQTLSRRIMEVEERTKGSATRGKDEKVAENASVCLKKRVFASKASVCHKNDPFATKTTRLPQSWGVFPSVIRSGFAVYLK